MNDMKPITQTKIEKDSNLEKAIVESQESLSKLSHILKDYIYMDTNSIQYPVLKRRTKCEFYQDFNQEVAVLKSQIIQIQSFFPKKHLDSYTLVMKIIDMGSVGTRAWFHYNLIVIIDVLHTYIERINLWNSSDEEQNYVGFYILEGDTSFLHDMLCDISSFLYDLYMLKAYEYEEYDRKNQIKKEDNPFLRYRIMPIMIKTHKAHSRTLLDSCNGILHRSFYKNDINAVPLITVILRQMIELRFEELLGIQAVYKDENHKNIVKVVGKTYFELPELEKFAVLPVPLSALKAIYGWASEYVHRGVSDYYWTIFYVKQYLLDFILGNAYIEENYFGDLKNKISSLFNVTEECIMWRKNTNLIPVPLQRLEDIRKEIRNIGYWKFHDKEFAFELERIDLYMKREDVYQALLKKNPYIYKVDDKYFIIGYFIFKECKDEELCNKYDKLVTEVKNLETEYGKEIKLEKLDTKDLRLFIPAFNSIREYCSEQEKRFISAWNLEKSADHDIPIEKGVESMVFSMLSALDSKQIEQLSAQVIDFGWMSDQSIRLECVEKMN